MPFRVKRKDGKVRPMFVVDILTEKRENITELIVKKYDLIFPRILFSLSSLVKLDCINCHLTELPALPSGLLYLNCFNNHLMYLPDILPTGLIKLDCAYNKLINLPNTLPASLTTLDCNSNNISNLPDTLPDSLTRLYCYHNQLINLPDTLPVGLTELSCSYNKLINLPDTLPVSLTKLDCKDNRLTILPDTLPVRLTVFDCRYNQLINLPNILPIGLLELNCSNNRITRIPYSIVNCRNLRNLNFNGNTIEYTHPVVHRFILNVGNFTANHHRNVYSDTQSVHNSSIQESIRKSIASIIDTSKRTTTMASQQEIILPKDFLDDPILSREAKSLIIEYCSDRTEHSLFLITFSELFVDVWQRIQSHPESNNIKAIFDTEMLDAECKCFTGRISRLVNSLNGFFDDISVQIADSDQISNIITIARDKLNRIDSYTVEFHRALVSREMASRGYAQDQIDLWISHIE